MHLGAAMLERSSSQIFTDWTCLVWFVFIDWKIYVRNQQREKAAQIHVGLSKFSNGTCQQQERRREKESHIGFCLSFQAKQYILMRLI